MATRFTVELAVGPYGRPDSRMSRYQCQPATRAALLKTIVEELED